MKMVIRALVLLIFLGFSLNYANCQVEIPPNLIQMQEEEDPVEEMPDELEVWVEKVEENLIQPPSDPKLLDFKAQAIHGQIRLSWNILPGSNLSGYELYKSHDGINFDKLFNIPPKGNDEDFPQYESWDSYPSPGISWYRIVQLDTDHHQSDSKAVQVYTPYQNGLEIFPNPSRGILRVKVIIGSPGMVPLEIYDRKGRQVFTRKFQLITGENTIRLDLGDLPKATYTLYIRSADFKPAQFNLE